jgi:ribonuclease T2
MMVFPVRSLRALVLTVLLTLGTSLPSRAGGTPGDFDYYVLSLSWSPTYCRSAGRNADPLQCNAPKPHRFIVHGLWPQYERGWPNFCRSKTRDPSRHTVSGILDIMPSRSLARHQWRKHGTCSGLSPEDYFDLTRQAFEKVRIPVAFNTIDRSGKIAPDAVEKAFRLANPGLHDAAMAVTCTSSRLKEVQICLNKDLSFRSCRAVDRSGCRSSRLTVDPPLRN